MVAIDGSESSLNALNHAVELSKLLDSQVHVISVIDELKLPFAAQYGLWAQESHERLIRSVLESLNEAIYEVIESNPETQVEAEVLEGDPSQKIVEYAENGSFELIVMGRKGYGTVKGIVLGSVSKKVVNTSTKPVLIV